MSSPWKTPSKTVRAFLALPYCLISFLLLTLAPEDSLGQQVIATSAEAQTSSDSQAKRVQQIRQMVHSLGPKPSTPAQIVQLTRGLPPAVASSLFLQIADDYLREGHCNLAANVLEQLLEQFPDEPAATEATLRLVQAYSSSEVAHTQRQTNDPARQLNLPAGWYKESAGDADGRNLSASERAGMLSYALHLANSQLQRHPELAQQPRLAFQCAVAARLSGQVQQSNSWLTLLKHTRESGQWRSRALVENWLQKSPDHEAPLPTTRCLLATEPPHLDGNLNENLWQTTDSFSPVSKPSDSSFEVLIARDAKFCYFAIRCKKIAGRQYAPDNQPRSHDADLSEHDRVVLRLDADRDYATCFRLAIDHRGQTADACWRDASWNPRWYVAADDQAESWSIEAAIPWSELTTSPPRAGEVWALSAQRFAPSQQSDSPPESFRLLIFP
jgi:hypothetical protein